MKETAGLISVFYKYFDRVQTTTRSTTSDKSGLLCSDRFWSKGHECQRKTVRTLKEYRAGKHMHTKTNSSLVLFLVSDISWGNSLPQTTVSLNSSEGRRRLTISCALRAWIDFLSYTLCLPQRPRSTSGTCHNSNLKRGDLDFSLMPFFLCGENDSKRKNLEE